VEHRVFDREIHKVSSDSLEEEDKYSLCLGNQISRNQGSGYGQVKLWYSEEARNRNGVGILVDKILGSKW